MRCYVITFATSQHTHDLQNQGFQGHYLKMGTWSFCLGFAGCEFVEMLAQSNILA